MVVLPASIRPAAVHRGRLAGRLAAERNPAVPLPFRSAPERVACLRYNSRNSSSSV